MAIEFLKQNKLVQIISAESTIKRLGYTHPIIQKQMRELVGQVCKVKISNDNSRKCIVHNQVFVYEDLEYWKGNKIKGGTFNPENLVI
jgi:hypothetical protein